MTLAILNRQRTKKINSRELRRMVLAALANLEIKSVELGINLVGEREMILLNETFLRHGGSTDVITFNHGGTGMTGTAGPALHGELFVCVDEAVLQARKFRGTWESEIVRYIVHGILHLLGHDDLSAAPRRRMKREEDRLVRLLSKNFSFAQLSAATRI